MLNQLAILDAKDRLNEIIFWVFGVVVLLSIFIALTTELYLVVAMPAVLIILYLSIVDFKQIYYITLFFLPITMEIELPGGFGSDIPTEPLVVGLMLIFILKSLQDKHWKWRAILRHPLIWILLLHYFWILITTLLSDLFIVSLKYLLAKTWYIVVYVFLTLQIVKREHDIKKIFWLVFFPLLLGSLYVIYKFRAYGFAFENVNEPMPPLYRNHVGFGAILAVFFPMVVLALTWYKRFTWRWMFVMGGLLWFLLSIQLSYTRTAYVALALAFAAYFIIQLRLVKYAIGFSTILIIGFVAFLLNDNKYINFAPNYESTITHHEFDDLINATYKLQDVSTMERVYRWVAGYHMVEDKWLFGFGPGNFYTFYRGYTEAAFKTYVSSNPDRSSVHNYFLLVFTEQGVFGFLIFILLTFALLIKGEIIYHQTPKNNTLRRSVVMVTLLIFIIIDAFLLMNDMIEAAKVGAFYFISIALLVKMDLLNKAEGQGHTPVFPLKDKSI